MSQDRPFLSVVVPVHDGAHVIPTSLDALCDSDFPREAWELIVVDDASRDDTAAVAARYADAVIRIPGHPHGPAYARNRGAEVARGDVLVFIDADVVAHADTLSRFAQVFREQPEISAVFGSYDDRPPAKGLMSQYRNLLHHYTHQRNAGEVASFWAGAGAMRRAEFIEAGMFDEWHFARPQIEDIELGARMHGQGKRIVLRPEIQVTHLKHWTLSNVVRTDLRDRGIPWSRLLAHSGGIMAVETLNLRWTEKLNVALAWSAVILVFVALWRRDPRFMLGSVAGVAFILAMNWDLLRFFARVRGFFFALRVIPAHLLYYLLNGVSFGTGLLLQQAFGAPLPDPTVEAWHEVGLRRWPPIPAKQRKSTWTGGE
jgi:glycosyltransferase involved in cell wall biosynthesis